MLNTISKLRFILFAIMGLGLASCERNATNVDIPTIDPQLVVQCAISPQDSSTKVYVSLTSPVFGSTSSQDWILNADVKISDGTTTVTLPNIVGSNIAYYETDSSTLKIIPGKTYTLWVNTTDGRSATAYCTVPYAVDANSLSYQWDTTSAYNSSSGGIERTVKLNMEWQDNPNEANYYRVGAWALTRLFNDTSRKFKDDMYNNNYTDLVDDKLNNGNKLARRDLQALVVEYTNSVIGDFSFVPVGIRMYLLNCDYNYYKYHESAESNINNDPFSEPTLMYTNIKGGLGYFGACNQYIKQIDF